MKLPKSLKMSYSSYVDRTGRLVNYLQPAAFCDTSFLLDYIDSDVHNPDYKRFPWNTDIPEETLFRDYLKSELRTKKLYKVREIVENDESKINLVFTPACRLEMEEVLSETYFRNFGVQVSD